MARRRVDITRTPNIADLSSIQQSPYVRKTWAMPWEFTLFEIYDPIFEELDNPSSALADPTKWTEVTREYVRQIVDTERSMLAPLYKGRPHHWQGNKLGMFLRTVTYRILDYKRLELPWLGYSPDWEIATTIRIGGKLRQGASGKPVEAVLDKWLNWLSPLGDAPKISSLRVNGRDFGFLCDFSGACGDACMALYTAFTAMPKDARIEAVGFFSPEQIHLRFLRIGRPGEMTAQI
jgi:hypothetical protein